VESNRTPPGNFVVRVQGGHEAPIVQVLAMESGPSPELNDLDRDRVCEPILAAIKDQSN